MNSRAEKSYKNELSPSSTPEPRSSSHPGIDIDHDQPSLTPEPRSSGKPRIDIDHGHRSPGYTTYDKNRGRNVSDEENDDVLQSRQESKEVKHSTDMDRDNEEKTPRKDDSFLRPGNNDGLDHQEGRLHTAQSTKQKNETPRRLRRGQLTRYTKGQGFQKSQFGQVRIGRDNKTKELVVIKECLMKNVRHGLNAQGFTTYENVELEIEIHKKISNDQNYCRFIIKLLDVVKDATYLFLILEYAPMGELGDYLNRRHLEINYKLGRQDGPQCLANWWRDSRRLMIQLLSAVKYLHGHYICHRDLSIENVVLDKDLNIKVIDFGLAQYCDGDVMFDTPGVGKYAYMSPECYNPNQNYYGWDNDMWSLGIILFFMLFAKFPWQMPYFIYREFNVIYGNRGGTEQFLKSQGLLRRAPKRVLDLFDRIFVAQKARITVRHALRHPYITNMQDDVFDPYYKCIAPALPDPVLQKKISNLRYNEELLRAPSIWETLDFKTCDEIHEFLWTTNSTAPETTVYDARVVKDLSTKFKLSKKESREVLHYFFAASRNQADLEYSLRRPRERTCNNEQSKWLDRSLQVDENKSSKDRNRRPEQDHSPQDQNRSPVDHNSSPRIFLPPRSDDKYENQDSSNLEEETPNETWLTSTERETVTRGSTTHSPGKGSPNLNVISPSLVLSSFDEITPSRDSSRRGSLETDDYSPESRK